MPSFDQMTDEELIEANALGETELDELERRLHLNAMVLGWTGEPMRQPLPEVAKIVRAILNERSLN